jgi:hypothetical protein
MTFLSFYLKKILQISILVFILCELEFVLVNFSVIFRLDDSSALFLFENKKYYKENCDLINYFPFYFPRCCFNFETKMGGKKNRNRIDRFKILVKNKVQPTFKTQMDDDKKHEEIAETKSDINVEANIVTKQHDSDDNEKEDEIKNTKIPIDDLPIDDENIEKKEDTISTEIENGKGSYLENQDKNDVISEKKEDTISTEIENDEGTNLENQHIKDVISEKKEDTISPEIENDGGTNLDIKDVISEKKEIKRKIPKNWIDKVNIYPYVSVNLNLFILRK